MDDESEGLLDRLSPEGRQLVPVPYRFLHTSSLRTATILRLVESKPYRAAGYVCSGFRKPISKCCGPEEETPENEPQEKEPNAI
jgi:hypothetical protein